MKPKVFLSLMFLIVSTVLIVSNTTAENEPYTQWGLPEGAKARIGKGGINDITCTQDGALLAVASQIGIWIYDVQTSEALALLTGHTGSVDRVAFSPDGRTLASGGQDNTVRLWDVETQTEIGTLEGHAGGPDSIFFSPDGRTLVSLDDDNTVRLWDVNTQTQIRTLEGYTGTVESVSFSPDGKTIATGGQDEIVRLWDVSTRTEIGTFEGHTGYVSSVAFSPDGKTIASGSWDGTVRIWDVSTRTEVGILEGHTWLVRIVAFSPDGKTIASGSNDNTLRLWDVGTRAEIGGLELGSFSRLVTGIAFSSDGQRIAIKRGYGSWSRVHEWEVATQILWNGYSHVDPEHIWEVYWVVTTLVREQQENIRTILEGHIRDVNSISFSPDGRILVSGSDSVGTVLWDVPAQTKIGKLENWGVRSVSFSPDGTTIATGGYGYGGNLWNVPTQTRIGGLSPVGGVSRVEYGRVRSVSFSPDGTTIATGQDNAIVRLYDVATQMLISEHWEHIWNYYWDYPGVNSVVFSPNGRILVSTGGIDGTVRMWDVDTWTEITILRGHTGWVNSVAFSPDGNTIVSGSNDRTLRLWDVETQTEIGTLEGHTAAVNSVAFNPDGKTIVSGSDDGTVRLWDVGTQTGMGTLKGHTSSVNSVEFSPGGKTIASGSDDGTVLLWNITSVDHGNTLIEATVLLLGGSLTAKIDPGNDVDYFSIPIEVRGQLTLWTTTTAPFGTIGTLQNSDGTILATNVDENGDEALNFRIEHVVEPGTYYIKVESDEQKTGDYTLYAAFMPATDVNRDGVVDVFDLMIVAENFGSFDTPLTGDVNGDGEVNREDINAVLDALEAATAPAAVSTTESLQRWIDRAKQLNRTDARFQKGIAVLQHLLTTLRETETVPKTTALLANYPNPFNPETWIPYQLAKPADVTLTIYSVEGALVRTLALGHQPAGIYHTFNRAAHWDGKNMIGEPVASGLYFYTLTAGDFSATRKLLIRK